MEIKLFDDFERDILNPVIARAEELEKEFLANGDAPADCRHDAIREAINEIDAVEDMLSCIQHYGQSNDAFNLCVADSDVMFEDVLQQMEERQQELAR